VDQLIPNTHFWNIRVTSPARIGFQKNSRLPEYYSGFGQELTGKKVTILVFPGTPGIIIFSNSELVKMQFWLFATSVQAYWRVDSIQIYHLKFNQEYESHLTLSLCAKPLNPWRLQNGSMHVTLAHHNAHRPETRFRRSRGPGTPGTDCSVCSPTLPTKFSILLLWFSYSVVRQILN